MLKDIYIHLTIVLSVLFAILDYMSFIYLGSVAFYIHNFFALFVGIALMLSGKYLINSIPCVNMNIASKNNKTNASKKNKVNVSKYSEININKQNEIGIIRYMHYVVFITGLGMIVIHLIKIAIGNCI